MAEKSKLSKAVSKKRRKLRKSVSSLVMLQPSLRPFEMIWAHIKGYANWPGIIEKETSDGKFLVHFFGDYSRSVVSKNKIMHLMEGFQIYSKAAKPTILLIKAIKEAQKFILDDKRDECPICEMLAIKQAQNLN